MSAAAASASSVRAMAEAAKGASRQLAGMDEVKRNAALEAMALAVESAGAELVAANNEDVRAEGGRLSAATLARLKLDEEKLAEMGTSEMAELRRRTVEAAAGGRDLLAEMAARVKGSNGMAMRRFELDSIRARRGEARLNAEALVTAEISSPKS